MLTIENNARQITTMKNNVKIYMEDDCHFVTMLPSLYDKLNEITRFGVYHIFNYYENGFFVVRSIIEKTQLFMHLFP